MTCPLGVTWLPLLCQSGKEYGRATAGSNRAESAYRLNGPQLCAQKEHKVFSYCGYDVLWSQRFVTLPVVVSDGYKKLEHGRFAGPGQNGVVTGLTLQREHGVGGEPLQAGMVAVVILALWLSSGNHSWTAMTMTLLVRSATRLQRIGEPALNGMIEAVTLSHCMYR